MKRSLWACILFLAIFILTACRHDEIPDDANDEQAVSLLKETLLHDDDYVTWLGRTHYEPVSKQQYFYHTASGFSVTFEGTSLSITIHATNTSLPNLRPYFSVLIDDQSPNEGKVLYLTEPTSNLVLVENLPYGVHTLTFLKRSEARDALTAIDAIETDGRFITPEKSYTMNLLILGGSGVSGNGVFGGPGILRTTANSSSLHAFGYQTATALNAHVQFVASSGWGLKWGYNPTNESGTINIRSAFDKIGIDDNQSLVDIDFDPTSFIPDFIIVNLGGNDYNAYIANLSGQERTEAERTFQDAVIEMVTYLHALYPSAFIYWTHTGSINGMLAGTVLSDLDPLRSFVEVVVIHSAGSNNDPIGSGNHASELTHQRNAAILIDKITHQWRD